MLSKNRIRFITLLASLTLVLAACDGLGGGGGCTLADFVMPDNLDPVGGIVADLSPMHVWNYAGCEPYGWRVEVTTYGGYAFGTTQTHDMVGAAATNWTFAMDLEPATQYEWHVAAWDGSDIGPYSTSTAYWTGPVCADAAMNAPIPGTPPDGSAVNNEFPPMGWAFDPPGCIPEQAHLQLDTDPAFPGPNLVDYAPGVFNGPHIGQIPMAALADCTVYHWRVRGENMGGNSPWSPTQSFFTDFTGTCAPPPICPTDELMAPLFVSPEPFDIVDVGHLFEWEYPIATCTPEGYAIQVNIRFTDQDDPTHWGGTGNPSTAWFIGEDMTPTTYYEWRVAGINGTDLGPWLPWIPFWTGPLCDPTMISTPTQLEVPDGSIVNDSTFFLRWDHNDCTPEETHVQVDDENSFSAPVTNDLAFDTFGGLLPEGLMDCTTYYWRVRGEANDGANVGPWSTVWSFITDFEGACGGPTATPAAEGGDEEPMAFAPQNNNCRAGDNLVFIVSGFFLQGETSPIIGKNADGSWLLLPKKTGGGNCWVATSLVELSPENALDLLDVYPSPPLPTSTPTPASSFQVTSVVVVVRPDEFKGTCPKQFDFFAEVTTNGAGTVDWIWTWSDGATGPSGSLLFGAAGTQALNTSWMLGGQGQNYNNYWGQLKITSPNALLSNQAVFDLSCN